jgi:hypothetical protein
MADYIRVNFTLPKEINKILADLTKIEVGKKSNIVARLIQRHYNITQGGVGAKQIFDVFDDAILELQHNKKISTDTYSHLKKYIERAKRELTMSSEEIEKITHEELSVEEKLKIANEFIKQCEDKAKKDAELLKNITWKTVPPKPKRNSRERKSDG